MASAIEVAGKDKWNAERKKADADFFTVGYAGLGDLEFLRLVEESKAQAVVDIRFMPLSRFKPAFSKNNLARSLAEIDVDYVHLRELGVPSDIRGNAFYLKDRSLIWDWYEDHVIARYARKNIHWFFNSANPPVVFLCVESDPTMCHRHRLALALERFGLDSYDL